MPLLELTRDIPEQTQERAKSIIEGAVRSCDNAVTQLLKLADDRGGKAALLVELGDIAQPIRDAAVACKAFVTSQSDLAGQDLEG
jgi:signal transduction histidine kinase